MGTGTSSVKVAPITAKGALVNGTAVVKDSFSVAPEPIKSDDCKPLDIPSLSGDATTSGAIAPVDPDDNASESYSFRADTARQEVKLRRKNQNLFHNMVVENIERDIQDYYDIDTAEVLGDGISGVVVRGVNKASGIAFAVKTLYKRNIKSQEYAHVKDEIRIMQELDHPNILRLHEYFEDNNFIFLVSELCTGGELLSRLYKQKECIYNERSACQFMYSMVSAIRYCHGKKIVHRDLKLENFLFVNEYPDSPLKLIGNNVFILL